MSNEAVQAMSTFCLNNFYWGSEYMLVLVSGWSDNGWLSGGHAVRMAMELCEFTVRFLRCRRT